MKKRIIKGILIMLLAVVPKINVSAEATASASIKVSTTSTVVGNSGTATLTISSNEAIGQIYGTFTCGDLGKKDLTYSASDSPSKSKTYTINWTAKSTGTYTCTVEGLEIGTLETLAWPKVSVPSATIKVVSSTSNKNNSSSSSNNSSSGSTTAEKKEYSSDNNLKSLSIEGYELTPEFNKDTTEYKLAVDQSIETLKINAQANDDKASVTGTGEVKLSNGENTFEIKVTAENGNEKKYKIIVTVEDQNPITVTVGKEQFTIVKKNNDLIEKLEYYDEETIQIEEQDVIAYTNANTKITLIILKDKDNKIGYYIYNKQNNTYEEYHDITINGVTLQLLDAPETIKYYKKYTLKLEEQTINYYKLKASHKIGLIYGTNVKNGTTGFWIYDQNEEILSKYYDEEINLYEKEIQSLKNYLMIFVGAVSFVTIIIIIVSIYRSKKKKAHKKYK